MDNRLLQAMAGGQAPMPGLLDNMAAVQTPLPGNPYAQPYQGTMTSANTPMGDAAAQHTNPLMGAILSGVERFAGDQTAVPGVEGGGNALMRGAMSAAMLPMGLAPRVARMADGAGSGESMRDILMSVGGANQGIVESLKSNIGSSSFRNAMTQIQPSKMNADEIAEIVDGVLGAGSARASQGNPLDLLWQANARRSGLLDQ